MPDTTPTPEDPIKTPAGETAKTIAQLLGAVGPFIPVALIPQILTLIGRYGPVVIDRLEVVFTKQAVTWNDFRLVFADLRTWESFGIPDVVPTAPAPSGTTINIGTPVG